MVKVVNQLGWAKRGVSTPAERFDMVLYLSENDLFQR
jgi:hypothetical protein